MMARKKKKKRKVYRKSCPIFKQPGNLIMGATGAVVGATVAVSAAEALGRI